jgi:hypothetical protein
LCLVSCFSNEEPPKPKEEKKQEEGIKMQKTNEEKEDAGDEAKPEIQNEANKQVVESKENDESSSEGDIDII